MFSTISTQFLLGSFNLLSVGLVILWALSPLGGQSTLRIIHTTSPSTASNATVTALNTEWLSFLEGGVAYATQIPTLNSLYLTSLIAPQTVKTSPVDQWGNVKIPMISQLDPAIKANDSGWYAFQSGADLPYSSLIGIPSIGVSQTGNTTFNLETSYFELDCFNLTSGTEHIPITRYFTIKNFKSLPARIVPVPNGVFIGSNGTETCPYASRCQSSFSIAISHVIENWTLLEKNVTEFRLVKGNEETFMPSPATILFQSKFTGGVAAFCSIRRIYVESAVSCVGDPTQRAPQCSVTAMRESLQLHEPSDIVPFLYSGTMGEFSSRLAQSAGLGHATNPTITELYLNNTESPLVLNPRSVMLTDISKRQLSHRLSQVLNTYYSASIVPGGMTGDLAGAFPPIKDPAQFDYFPHATRRVPAVISTHPYDIYVLSAGWMAVFMISSISMFVAAVMSMAVGLRTMIPDVLGYASTMTRDSKYFRFPPGGSRLDGLARSRLLRDLVVRLGDVRSESEIGHVAFAESTAATKVNKKGVYE